MASVIHAGARAQPLSRQGLPRLTAAWAQSSLSLARLMGRLPRTIDLPVLGDVCLSPIRATPGPAVVSSSDEPFALENASGVATLIVSQRLALHVVNALLGLPPPVAMRALGRVERGALAGAVAALLDRASMNPDVQVRVARPPIGSAAATVDLAVTVVAMRGHARLLLPASWLREGAHGGGCDGGVARGTLAVTLARTLLPAATWAGARPGDAVVFDQPALDPGAPWPVRARVGLFDTKARLDARGGLVLCARFSPRQEDFHTMPDPENTQPDAALVNEATRLLASAPVELVAELGRVTVTAHELAGLLSGAVLALGPRRGGAVTLLVGGRPWARGELVAVDDELGVRIIERLDR